MIEIRELVIRATVEDRPSNTANNQSNSGGNQNRKNCCQDNLEMLLKMIKDKKER